MSYSESNGKFYFYRCVESSSNGISFSKKQNRRGHEFYEKKKGFLLLLLIYIFLFRYLSTVSNYKALIVSFANRLRNQWERPA